MAASWGIILLLAEQFQAMSLGWTASWFAVRMTASHGMVPQLVRVAFGNVVWLGIKKVVGILQCMPADATPAASESSSTPCCAP